MLFAQGNPVGPEFRVNTYTTGRQTLPAAASDAGGDLVVVWHGTESGPNDYGIFAQRYAVTGAPLGGEFHVNSYTTQQQRYPSVASDAAGNFVVVWQSIGQGNDYWVIAQRYASTGAPLGPQFRVNTFTLANKKYPAVASDPGGNFVVAWMSYYQDGFFDWGIYAQRFASTGAPIGGEFRVNTFIPGNQGRPSVASDAAGNFVVVWQSYQQDGSFYGVFGQRYASTGAPLGGEFRVNTLVPGFQWHAKVASDAAGNFVVAWDTSLGTFDLLAQRFAATGAPLGGEFRVNTDTTNFVVLPSVTADAAGNFVIVWQDGPTSPDGSGYGVFGQRYASTGAPLGGEFRVNTYTTHNQRFPSVAADSTGRFVVVWESYLQEGQPNGGIFGQRYSMIVPVELLDFTVH